MKQWCKKIVQWRTGQKKDSKKKAEKEIHESRYGRSKINGNKKL